MFRYRNEPFAWEWPLIAALGLALPSVEAPKNALFMLLALSFIARGAGIGRGRWPLWGLLLAGMVVVAGISTGVNWPSIGRTKGFRDVLTSGFLALYFYRTAWTAKQIRGWVVSVVIGVLLGLVWGTFDVIRGEVPFLEFHSAGDVTESVVYLLCGLGLTTGYALFERDTVSRAGWVMAAATMVAAVFIMNSRGGILAFALAAALFVMATRNTRLFGAAVVVTVLAMSLASHLPAIFNQDRAAEKAQALADHRLTPSDEERMTFWKIALAEYAQTDHKWWGIGPRNYEAINEDALRFPEPRPRHWGKLAHAHNLFLNQLVEQGAAGLLVMVGFFAALSAMLLRDFAKGRSGQPLWFAALAALTVTVIADSFNAPFAHESANLAVMIWALYARQREPQGRDQGPFPSKRFITISKQDPIPAR